MLANKVVTRRPSTSTSSLLVSEPTNLATGETVRVTPETHPDLFWATAGGLGLTGVTLDATFDLSPIETSRLLVDTDRTPDLDTTLALMDEGDDRYPYSVAWIDLMKTGPGMGRSILGRGSFAPRDDLRKTTYARRLSQRSAAPVLCGAGSP